LWPSLLPTGKGIQGGHLLLAAQGRHQGTEQRQIVGLELGLQVLESRLHGPLQVNIFELAVVMAQGPLLWDMLHADTVKPSFERIEAGLATWESFIGILWERVAIRYKNYTKTASCVDKWQAETAKRCTDSAFRVIALAWVGELWNMPNRKPSFSMLFFLEALKQSANNLDEISWERNNRDAE
jgi:hypothetical protein